MYDSLNIDRYVYMYVYIYTYNIQSYYILFDRRMKKRIEIAELV